MAQELTFQQADVHEELFARGWTDGLPVVPPTPARVTAMLDSVGMDPDHILGTVPERSREISAEKAAINAVMAGCRPEYFPVVLAAIDAMLDPIFCAHTVVTSTGGAALCLLISGPLVAELGFNTQANALGPGNRANATVGRAVRLVATNVLGAKSGTLDASSLGHPGKYTMVVAEESPPPPWDPLRVQLGFDASDTTVTIFPSEGPHQVANHVNSDPEGILATFLAAMTNPATYGVGRGHQVALVLGYEHRHVLAEAGWTPQRIREYLAEHSRVTPQHLEAGGIVLEYTSQHNMTTDADGKLGTVRTPDDILLITAGSPGAGWSAYIPSWAPCVHAESATRRVTS